MCRPPRKPGSDYRWGFVGTLAERGAELPVEHATSGNEGTLDYGLEEVVSQGAALAVGVVPQTTI